jgi:hypothetical protein
MKTETHLMENWINKSVENQTAIAGKDFVKDLNLQ